MSELSSTKQTVLVGLQINKVLSLNLSLQGADENVEVAGHVFSEDYLIVHINSTLNVIYAINAETIPRLPIKLDYSLVCAAIDEGVLDVIDMVWPVEILMPFDELSPKQQAKANERFDVIRPLVQDLEETLRSSYGDNRFQQVIDSSGRSRQYVYDCFNAFLVYGCRKAGLALKIGKNLVHVPKSQREIRVKLGRPNTTKAEGKILDDYDYRAFRACKRLYQKRNGPTLIAAFELMLEKHYYDSRVLNDIRQRKDKKYKVVLKPPTERPTSNQFYYWLMNECGGATQLRDKDRRNPLEQKKDFSGRKGDAFGDIIAFGQAFELDETPFDEELVSVFDPTRSTNIGKATVYFVVDRFTVYILGFYITTESPSYKTVRQALYSAGRDKSDYFAELGFDAEFDWRYNRIPLTLFVDHAEFNNKISEGAVFDLQTQIKFTRAGRGDDKPTVEKMFDVFRMFFLGLSPGQQTKSLTDIFNQLARKHAALTVRELNLIVVVYINYHNNYRLIRRLESDRSLMIDGVEPIPAKLVEWSLTYRPGYAFHYSDAELYMKLLAKGEVSVHQHGIYFKGIGLWYNCEWVLQAGYQDKRANRNRAVPMICRYNENFVDVILIQTSDGLKIATLDTRSSAYSGLSHHEVLLQKDSLRRQEAELSEEELAYRLGFRHFMLSVLRQANHEKVRSAIPNLSTIKNNREMESYINRFADINLMLQALKHEMGMPFALDDDDNNTEHVNYREFDADDNDDFSSGRNEFDNDEDE